MSDLRVPPHSHELERALISAILCDDEVLAACDGLLPEHFYVASHSQIYGAILGVVARGMRPDLVTVPDQISVSARDKGAVLEQMLEITSRVLPTHEPEIHAREIRHLAQRRHVINALLKLASIGYDRKVQTRDWFEDVEREIFASTSIAGSDEMTFSRLDPTAVMKRLIDASKGIKPKPGLTTGVGALDRKLLGLGLIPKRLYIVAGRPGMGKSALCLGTARAVSMAGLPALFVSLEMSREECAIRCMSLATGISGRSVDECSVTQEQIPKLARGAEEMSQSAPFANDEQDVSLPQLRAAVRRHAAKHGKIGVLVVDHIGLMSSGERTQSREQEVSALSRGLKRMAKEFDCPVIALAQLNRECEKRPDKRPQLSDLRDSGSLEQDADAVIFVYRAGYYAAKMAKGELQDEPWQKNKTTIVAGADDGKAELIIAKQRGAGTGVALCRFDDKCTRFVDFGFEDARPEATFRGADPIHGDVDHSNDDGEPFERDDQW